MWAIRALNSCGRLQSCECQRKSAGVELQAIEKVEVPGIAQRGHDRQEALRGEGVPTV